MKHIEISEDTYIKLSDGSTLFVSMGHPFNGIIYTAAGHSVHAYAGNLSSGANIEVSLHDNIQMEIFRGKKDNPLIKITHDEWPCSVEITQTDKMKVSLLI